MGGLEFDDTEDGRDPANRSSDDLKKPTADRPLGQSNSKPLHAKALCHALKQGLLHKHVKKEQNKDRRAHV